jgi:hypothetical protein
MILAGRKGKNTVQAFVIIRNFMDEKRNDVNQTNNDIIKNTRGVRQGWGSNARCTKPEKRPTLYAKSGEFVNTE